MKILVALVAFAGATFMHAQDCSALRRTTDAFTGVGTVVYPTTYGQVIKRDTTVLLELPFMPDGQQRLREGEPLDLLLMDRRLLHLTMERVSVDGRRIWATMAINSDEARWLSWTPILSIRWHTSTGTVQKRMKERNGHRLQQGLQCVLSERKLNSTSLP